MYYVKLYNKEDQCFFNAPFVEKEQAIKYFNTKLDQNIFFESVPFMNYKRIEILHDNCVLFDYEV